MANPGHDKLTSWQPEDEMANGLWTLQHTESDSTIKVDKKLLRAGRSNHVEIVCLSNKVSRNHANFTLDQNGMLHVKDNNSSNGTFVNGQKISGLALHQLFVNDEVGLGVHSTMNFEQLGADKDIKYIFVVQKINYTTPNNVIIVNSDSIVNVSDDPRTNEEVLTTNSDPIDNISHGPITALISDPIENVIDGCITNNIIPINSYFNSNVISDSVTNDKVLTSNCDTVGMSISNDPITSEELYDILDSQHENVESDINKIDKKPQDRCPSNSGNLTNEMKLNEIEWENNNENDAETFKKPTNLNLKCAINRSTDRATLNSYTHFNQQGCSLELTNGGTKDVNGGRDDIEQTHDEIIQPVNIKKDPEIVNNTNIHNGYTIDDGYIVINDDDDFPCSQLINDKCNGNNGEPVLFDSIFCTIKQELEELDKLEDGRVYSFVDLMDSDGDENLSDLLDNKSNKKEDSSSNTPDNDIPKNPEKNNAMKTDNYSTVTTLSFFPDNSIKNNYVKPPIISPHMEIKSKNNKSTSNSKKATKRKSTEKQDIKPKKIKTTTFYNKTNREYTRKSPPASKEQINEIRKRKLKEIAGKDHVENQTKSSTSKHSTAKVKVSDGRGKFLTESFNHPSTTKHKQPITSNKHTDSKASKVIDQHIKNHKNTAIIDAPKKLPLVPQSVIPKPKTAIYPNRTHHGLPMCCKGIEDLILNFLHWKVTWFEAPNDQTPPIINQPLCRMPREFVNYPEYYEIVRPIFELELWNYIHKGIGERSDPRKIKFLARIRKEIKMKQHTELDCVTYITKEQCDRFCHIKEEDATMLQFVISHDNQNITIPLIGFVTRVYKKNLQPNDFLDSNLGKAVGKPAFAELYFIVLIPSYVGTADLDKYMHIRVTASLTPTIRVIRSVRCLERSSLCQHILKPKIADYRVVNTKKEVLCSKDKLNASQYEAVMEATHVCLQKKPGIYLIQGPPGTGKSTVIVNIIQQILFREHHNTEAGCLLVVAPSNAAIDELTLRLIALKTKLEAAERKQIKLIRMGPKNMISQGVQTYSLDEMAKRNIADTFLKTCNASEHQQLLKMQQHILKLNETCDSPDALIALNARKLEFEKKCRIAMGRAYNENLRKTEENLLLGARIICTTLSSCVGMRMLDVFRRTSKISCCIVDEATQSREQETLIPLMLGINKLILVGDPKQLPAVTLSKQAKENAHGMSLFSRIMSHFNGKSYNPIRMLNVQYRMHPEICEFPNKNYYNGKLKNDISVKTRHINLKNVKPYLVFNLKTEYCSSQEYLNRAEIDVVLRLLDAIDLIIDKLCNYTIGIVTPYNHQKEEIKCHIKKRTFKRNVHVSVNTVDSFQGQERDIMIMSCVRDYSNNFLRDEQRLNVAITRAKHALYVIGSDNLFRTCTVLGKLYDDAKKRNFLINASHTTTKQILADMIKTSKNSP